MKEFDIETRNLLASAKNLIGVIKNKQWERLDSQTWNFETAVKLFEEKLKYPSKSQDSKDMPE